MANHPIHPALVHMPIGLWTAASLADGLSLIGASSFLPDNSSAYLIGGGLLFSVPAIAAGIFDFAKLLKTRKALIDKIMIHASVMAGAASFYLLALLLRLEAGALTAPSLWAILCSGFGFALLALGGWLGGNLVYGHGANVSGLGD